MKTKELVLSLTDLAQAIIKAKYLILCVGLFFMGCTFFYFLLQPIHFTAKGIFKSGSAQSLNSNSFVNALQFFERNETYWPRDEPRSFLRSYPILEKTVLALHLQATISGNKRPSRMKEIWYTFKTAIVMKQLKNYATPSLILTPKIKVVNQKIIPDLSHEVLCSALYFPEEVGRSLTIKWRDKGNYRVFLNNKFLGHGEMGVPFYWDGGYFTLTGNPTIGRHYGLHLVPLEEAVASLQNSIKVIRDKENAALLHISYTHRDRHLASAIVNTIMEQFECYLKQEGDKKVSKQLAYLQERQANSMEHLEGVLKQHQEYLEKHLDTGSIVSLEKELEFMVSRQSLFKHEMLNFQTEMQAIFYKYHPAQNVNLGALSFTDLCQQLKMAKKPDSLSDLSIENVKNFIRLRQQELDQLYWEREQNKICRQALQEKEGESALLFNCLKDPLKKEHLEKIELLHHKLSDNKNWSAKEQQQFKSELETEKRSLMDYLNRVQESSILQEQILKERIRTLEENLLFLLLNGYEQAQLGLNALSNEVSQFPKKWLEQQKVDLNTKIYTEMMESITKMIEAKNIGYNLDYLLASSFKKAVAPIIPDPPKIFLGTFLGGIYGIFMLLLALLIYTVWKGPSASIANLIAVGRRVISEKERIPQLGLHLLKEGPITLFSSQKTIFFLPALMTWLMKQGERVILLDFSSKLPPFFLLEEEKGAYLASARFHHLLENYKKSYDRIFLVSKAPIESFEMSLLTASSDLTVYGIYNEKLAQLHSLPEKTLFFANHHQLHLQKLSLKKIKPKLEALIKRMEHASFSSDPFWRRFPLRKP